jgi:2-dehydropantoate 2-reductase
MRICILGAGGVGGYFGGLLWQQGHQISVIARGAHLDAIRDKGLAIQSVHGDFTLEPETATDDPADVGPVDYVVVGVKHYQLDDACGLLPPLVGPETTVVPLLNGVDAHEHIMRAVDAERVVGGLCSIVSMVADPGVIRQESQLRRVVVGELDGSPSQRVSRILDAWREAGAEAIQPDNIHSAMWGKLLFIASFGGVSSLSLADAGAILRFPETKALFVEAMQEVAILAEAEGVSLPPGTVDQRLAFLEAFEPTATPSMMRDVVDGNVFELEAFSGTIVHRAKARGLSLPVHEAFYGLLLPRLHAAMEAKG